MRASISFTLYSQLPVHALQAAILVAGWAPASDRLSALFQPKLPLPSLHIIASKADMSRNHRIALNSEDNNQPYNPTKESTSGEMLVSCFGKPKVFFASVPQEELLHDHATYQHIAAWLQSIVA